MEQAVQRALEHGEAFDMELRLITTQGKHLWVHAICKPHIVTGKTVRLTGTFQDITERKLAEEALQKSEEKYRTLFERSRDAVMTLAPPSWNFTSANPATVEMFGVKDEAHLTSLTPWDLSPETQPDERPSAEKAMEMFETAMREGSNLFEWTHKRVNGEEFPATVLLSRMELNGVPMLQATVRDVTHEIQLESQLRQAQKMEAIGQLAGGVAHDFNNLLQVILAYDEMALCETEPGTAINEEIENIVAAGGRAAKLVSQLLAFSHQVIRGTP